MKIIRNGKTYTLTADELYEAYKEQKHNFMLGDAEAQFKDYLRFEHKNDEQKFASTFGFTCEDVCDPDSAYYLLEKFVASYEKHHDCNDAENDMWQEVIRNILLENAVNVKITYDVNYVLWDVTIPELTRKITELYPNGFASVDKLMQAEPAYLAAACERHGVRNGKVRFTRQIKRVRNIGDNADLRDWHFYGMSQSVDATLEDGKLVLVKEG